MIKKNKLFLHRWARKLTKNLQVCMTNFIKRRIIIPNLDAGMNF